jgi:hypothetical protein
VAGALAALLAAAPGGGREAHADPGAMRLLVAASAAGLVVHRDDGEIVDTAGAVVLAERLLATPLGVLEHARRVLVTTPKDPAVEVPATAIYRDARRNLAFLWTPVAVTPPVELATAAESPASGELVFLLHATAAGPLPGRVIGIRQDEDGVRWVYVQVPGPPGADYRGGLVVSEDGRMVAMVVNPVSGTQDLLAGLATAEIADAVRRLTPPAMPPAGRDGGQAPGVGSQPPPIGGVPRVAATIPAPPSDRRFLPDGTLFAPPPAPPVSTDDSLFASQLEEFRRLVGHMRNIAWRIHREPLNQLTRELWEDVYFRALSELGILRLSGHDERAPERRTAVEDPSGGARLGLDQEHEVQLLILDVQPPDQESQQGRVDHLGQPIVLLRDPANVLAGEPAQPGRCQRPDTGRGGAVVDQPVLPEASVRAQHVELDGAPALEAVADLVGQETSTSLEDDEQPVPLLALGEDRLSWVHLPQPAGSGRSRRGVRCSNTMRGRSSRNTGRGHRPSWHHSPVQWITTA